MIREKFAEPAIPRQIDLMQRNSVPVRVRLIFHQCRNAQIHILKVRIGAEMIAHQDRSDRRKLSDRLIQLLFSDTGAPKRRRDLADKERPFAATEYVNNRVFCLHGCLRNIPDYRFQMPNLMIPDRAIWNL